MVATYGAGGLFIVMKKGTDDIRSVYDVKIDKAGYAHFLIYDDGQWKYMKAKHFEPVG